MKNGWKTHTLNEVTELITCGVAKRPEYEKYGIPFLSAKNVKNGSVIWKDYKFISEIAHKKLTKNNKPKLGDLLYTRVGSYGEAAIVDREIEFSIFVSLTLIKPKPIVLNSFLKHYLNSPAIKDLAANSISGIGVGNLNVGTVRKFPIPLPSLPEQRRIVGILDEAFDAIATAKANAEKNLKNARALYESQMQALFAKCGGEWDRVTLATLLERGWIESHLDGNHGGNYPRKDEFISKGIPYISANCLDNERIDMTRAKYLSPERAALLRKGIAKDSDVLFAHNATVGPVAILRTDEAKVILGTSLTYYRCNQRHILPTYLAHYMRSFGFKVQYLQIYCDHLRRSYGHLCSLVPS